MFKEPFPCWLTGKYISLFFYSKKLGTGKGSPKVSSCLIFTSLASAI